MIMAYILRTVDGGATWLNATPAGLGSIGPSATLFVLDGNTVWALVPGTDFYTASLYHTRDGGVTWTSNPVPFGGAYIQFQDGIHRPRPGRPGSRCRVECSRVVPDLRRRCDLGQRLPQRSDRARFIRQPALGGIKNGMTFLDTSTGWVTGSIPVAGDVYCLRNPRWRYLLELIRIFNSHQDTKHICICRMRPSSSGRMAIFR